MRYAYYPFGDEWRFNNPGGEAVAVRVSGKLTTSDPDLLRSAATAGLGVGLFAPFNIHDELRAGALVPLLRSYPTPLFSIACIYPHRRHLAAKVRVFIDALAKLFARVDWLDSEGAAPPG
jgi:DNA-binding transcriptional LysR family regulator